MKEHLFRVILIRPRDEYAAVLVRATDDDIAADAAMDRCYDDDLSWEPTSDSCSDIFVDTVERMGVAEKVE